MADILFNKSEVPLIAYGKSYQATTTGTPSEKPKNTSQPKNPDEDTLSVGNIQISAGGPANDFPKKADEIINSVGVLNTEKSSGFCIIDGRKWRRPDGQRSFLYIYCSSGKIFRRDNTNKKSFFA